jgi:hypothetical protein
MNFIIRTIYFENTNGVDKKNMNIWVGGNDKVDFIIPKFNNKTSDNEKEVLIWLIKPSLNDIANKKENYFFLRYKQSENFTITAIDIAFTENTMGYRIVIPRVSDEFGNIDISHLVNEKFNSFNCREFDDIIISGIGIGYTPCEFDHIGDADAYIKEFLPAEINLANETETVQTVSHIGKYVGPTVDIVIDICLFGTNKHYKVMVKNIPNAYRYKITNINVEHKTKHGYAFISDVKNLMMEIGQPDDKSNIQVVIFTQKLLEMITEYKEK